MTSQLRALLALLSASAALAFPAVGSAAVYYPATGGGGGGNGDKAPGVVCNPLKPGKCSPGPDTKAPQTEILRGPKGRVGKTTVRFGFKSNEKGSTFRCKLDRKPYRVCKSPKTYKNLKPGKHVFKVRAVDKAGNIDPTAAKRKFVILG